MAPAPPLTPAQPATPAPRRSAAHAARLAVALAGLVAFALYLSTLQTEVNGYDGAYGTDVGEIQNALPRWGTIHFSGYPLYTATGSAFVALLGLASVPPAASASLWSALWAAVAVGLIARLALDLGAPGPAAVAGALVAAVAQSIWAYASLAHVHTLTLAFTLGTLWLALRFGRTGARRDLLWLALVFSQGIAHQRATAALLPTVGLLVWPHRRAIWRDLPLLLGIGLLAPLTYLYLALRAWMGATWVFGSPGTWSGLLALLLDTKFDRVVVVPQTLGDLRVATERVLAVTVDDLPAPALALGLVGPLAALVGRPRVAGRVVLGLLLAGPPFLVAALFIWEGRVSDALLAVRLPALALAGLGIALLAGAAWRWQRAAGLAAVAATLAFTAAQAGAVRPVVWAIVTDPSAERVIRIADAAARRTDGRPTTLMAPWGRDYWALAYAQAFAGRLPGLTLVDHNADFRAILARGDRLWVLSTALYVRPLDWWRERLGVPTLALDEPAEGVVELSPKPERAARPAESAPLFDLGNGVQVAAAELERVAPDALELEISWRAVRVPLPDYSVAVHLVGHEPVRGPADVLAQADRSAPVDGWYPTSLWGPGEVVHDRYVIPVPPGRAPVAVRVALYRQVEPGRFRNSAWLTLPLPTAQR